MVCVMADDATKKDGASYYYEIGGAEHGPIGKARMIQLAQLGSIRAATRVWTDAMPVKTAASKLPFLAPHLRRGPARVTQLLVGGASAAVGIAVLGAFLWMVPPAAAREGESACRGLAGQDRPKPALCPDGQACSLPMPAPDFTAIDHKGKPVKLSDFRGKVVLLNFWASWCGTCKVEKSGLAEMAKDLAGPDLKVIALASDSEWSKAIAALIQSLRPNVQLPITENGISYADAMAAYGREFPEGLDFDVLLDPPQGDDTIGVIARRWGLEKVPETVLIDREGNIRAYFVNKRDWSSSVAQTCIRSVLDE
jgi:thiol-disulfide isomerase/thioredoxin